MSDQTYTKRIMNCPDQHLQAWADRIRESFTDHPTTTLWGIWQGVFGLAAHQLIIVSAHPELEDNWQRPRDCEVERQWIVESHRTSAVVDAAYAPRCLCIPGFLATL